MNAAVFLARDNTIIEAGDEVHSPDDVTLIQGAASAIASLRGLGYRIVVITNAPQVARGRIREQAVEQIHQRISDLVRQTSGGVIDRFYFCPYDPAGKAKGLKRDHPWRLPNAGMLEQAAEDLNIDLSQSWTIGASADDIEAGTAAKTRTIFLHAPSADHGTGQPGAALPAVNTPYFKAGTLVEAIRIVAQQLRPDSLEVIREKPSLLHRAAANQMPSKSDAAAPATAPVAPSAPPRVAPTPISLAGAPTAQAHAVPAHAGTPVKAPAPPPEAPPSRETTPPETIQPPAATTHASAASSATDVTPYDTAPAMQPPATTSAPVASAQRPSTTAPALSQSSASPTEAATSQAPPPVDPTLKQILQELRNQRAGGIEFSFMRITAIVVQLLAVLAVIIAVIMGAGDATALIAWIGGAIFLQLVTITMLLFDHR